MIISVKGMTNTLTLRTNKPNKKQKASTAITEIINQDLCQFFREFKNSFYLGYKKKKFPNDPTEA